jgi:hypothetical protein
VAFASFEERCKEFDRARVIFKYALDHIPKHEAQVRFPSLLLRPHFSVPPPRV